MENLGNFTNISQTVSYEFSRGSTRGTFWYDLTSARSKWLIHSNAHRRASEELENSLTFDTRQSRLSVCAGLSESQKSLNYLGNVIRHTCAITLELVGNWASWSRLFPSPLPRLVLLPLILSLSGAHMQIRRRNNLICKFWSFTMTTPWQYGVFSFTLVRRRIESNWTHRFKRKRRC